MKPIYYAVMSLPKSVLTLCLAVWIGCTLAPTLFAQGYMMVTIARPYDPAPDGRLFFSATFPSVNDQSQVAFVGCFNRFACDVYLYDQGQIIPIAQPGDLTDRCGTLGSLFDRPSLNGFGQIAFTVAVTQPPGEGLFLFDGSQLVTLVCTGDPTPDGGTFRQVFTASLNNQEQVAFIGGLSNGTQGVFFYDGREIRKIVVPGDPAPEGGWFVRVIAPSLNDQGQIVFNGEVSQPGRSGLFLFDQGEIRKVVQALDPAPDGGVFGGIYYPALNAFGQVVFNAEVLEPHGAGLFLFDGRDIRRITPARDPDTGDDIRGGGPPVINRFGHIAFVGNRRLPDGQFHDGVFLFDGRRFITVGLAEDPMPDDRGIFGNFSMLSLNALEQVAFTTDYVQQYVSGVFLALPNR